MRTTCTRIYRCTWHTRVSVVTAVKLPITRMYRKFPASGYGTGLTRFREGKQASRHVHAYPARIMIYKRRPRLSCRTTVRQGSRHSWHATAIKYDIHTRHQRFKDKCRFRLRRTAAGTGNTHNIGNTTNTERFSYLSGCNRRPRRKKQIIIPEIQQDGKIRVLSFVFTNSQ